MDKKEQTKLRVQRYRERQRSVTNDVTQSPNSVTESVDSVTLDVTQYPAILHALTDPEKRRKLEKIYQSLNSFKVADKVYYGCSKDSVPFDVVGELLEATVTQLVPPKRRER